MPDTSEVWTYFTRSVENKSVTCKLCSVRLSYMGTTTNLWNHVKAKHPSSQSESSKQQSMKRFTVSGLKHDLCSEEITKKVVNMVVTDYLPISIVESQGFRDLLAYVAPSYSVPRRTTIRSRIMARYDEERAALAERLESVPITSITTDTWTSNATDSYITVTEHHVTADWEIEFNVLMTREMPERHTGDNLALRLQGCASEFGISGRINTCVHDNARNMERAETECDLGSLGCFGHTLQLSIKSAFALPDVNRVVSRCRKLVGHIKHSTTLMAEMRKRHATPKVPKHELMQDVTTRWNSTHAMLARLHEQRRVLSDLMLDTRVTRKADQHLSLKDGEWTVVSELSDVLSHLTVTTSYMSTEKNVSCSEVYPIVTSLLDNTLRACEADSHVVKEVKGVIAADLRRRFRPSNEATATSTPVLAALLDPRYKDLDFLSTEQRRYTEDALESRLDDVPLRLPTPDESASTPSKRPRLSFMVPKMTKTANEPSDEEATPFAW
ncbi:E3 SUMO-protein ligase ZBED1-like [Mya arenaria]|uniref:E3 SUMO-protein ligase ZBED1-like n=1 Tax=Mya arenaria TaxID=6604 RepID=UPI0022E6EDE5|nr:E3 SUMO-protein ligase ZBED1-like [Mya arenaria]